ncbi:GGDEF domain-containing protein [Paenibacillus illinoisensis]|uniref:GGDEF domain-containing protein n=2 Tax=Paenibacillus illinoisensis TaxID=59845 RepID=UPI00301CE66F
MNGGGDILTNTYVIEVITAAVFWFALIQLPKRNTEIYNGDFIFGCIHLMTLISLSIYYFELVTVMSEICYIFYFYRLNSIFRQHIYKKEKIMIAIGSLILILFYIFTSLNLSIVLLIVVIICVREEVRASTYLLFGSIIIGLLTTISILQTTINFTAGDTYSVLRVLVGIYLIVCVLNIYLKIMRSTYNRSITDSQTGVYNRNKIHQIIENLWSNDQTRLSLMYMSLDNPISLNSEVEDTEDDKVLHSAAIILKSEIEPFGYVGRQKGLEFLAVVNDCDVQSLAESIRKRITEEVVHTTNDGVVKPVPISIGICEKFDGWSIERNIKYVVKAMGMAKLEGVNQVVQLEEEV